MNVLVLAPHTDDGEFGCGGTIARLISEGDNVFYAAFSACKESVINGFPKDILVTEVVSATSKLGIKPENLILYDFEVRTFNYHRQEILDKLIMLRQKINPDMVFLPSENDIHQDHHTIAVEGIRAFKNTSVLAYEILWNNLSFNTRAFFHLTQEHLSCKIEALKEYKSQAHRPYANEDFIRSLAKTRGVQIGSDYAEVFDVVRWVIK